jgi:hypothetical protein
MLGSPPGLPGGGITGMLPPCGVGALMSGRVSLLCLTAEFFKVLIIFRRYSSVILVLIFVISSLISSAVIKLVLPLVDLEAKGCGL